MKTQQIYSNLPLAKPTTDATVQAFDAYSNAPLELNASEFDAVTGFFESRGFDKLSSQSIAVIIIRQAKKDGYNAMKILDTLKGFDSVEISALVSEILNYNRFKTSFLGYALAFYPNQEVTRNIIP